MSISYERTPFEMCSNGVRQTFLRSQNRALRLNHNYIDEADLMIELLGAGSSDPSSVIIANVGLNQTKIRSDLEFSISLDLRAKPTETGLTESAKSVLISTFEEALIDGVELVTNVHLLRAIVRQGVGIAASTFISYGVDIDALRVQSIPIPQN